LLDAAKTLQEMSKPGSPISPTDVAELMLARNPRRPFPDAVADLYEWICRNRVRLWCNDNLVSPDFAITSLRLVARSEADGRWRVDAVPAGGIGWAPGSYTFAFDADDIRRALGHAVKPELQPAIQLVVDAMIASFPPWGDPGTRSEKEAHRILSEKHKIHVVTPESGQAPAGYTGVARSTYSAAVKHIRQSPVTASSSLSRD
jgi:hypothetical protein